MRPIHALLAAVIGPLLLVAPAAAQEPPQVVASIKPVNSLVAGVMEGVGEPYLLIPGGGSPHTYALRPSDAEALAGSDAVFWIGEELEVFLGESVANIGGDARSVELIEVEGLVLHSYGEEHDHHEHGHGHEHEHGHDHSGVDAHIWLDPANARAMVAAIAATLAEIDPAHAALYEENAAAMTKRLAELEETVTNRLAPHRDVPFLTFHDSFGYFTERFGLASRGAITLSPERPPGARRLAEIREEIAAYDRVCIFSEPQFPPDLVGTVTEGTDAGTGTVDPLGAGIADGPDLYFELIETNAETMAECLSGE